MIMINYFPVQISQKRLLKGILEALQNLINSHYFLELKCSPIRKNSLILKKAQTKLINEMMIKSQFKKKILNIRRMMN